MITYFSQYSTLLTLTSLLALSVLLFDYFWNNLNIKAILRRSRWWLPVLFIPMLLMTILDYQKLPQDRNLDNTNLSFSQNSKLEREKNATILFKEKIKDLNLDELKAITSTSIVEMTEQINHETKSNIKPSTFFEIIQEKITEKETQIIINKTVLNKKKK